jgi:hypothetical protein
MSRKFDIDRADPQATAVTSVKPENFDFEEYTAYAGALDQRCRALFSEKDSGALVYRRMRVAECFSYGCKDMEGSLNAQLGALKFSMDFKTDVPNFLEPWYGIGPIDSAYGGDYVNPDKPVPVQYQSAANDLRMKNLGQLAKELHVSLNAVVLRWMMQASPVVIPVMAGSSVAQMKENMQALACTLNDAQLALLNQDITQPNQYA